MIWIWIILALLKLIAFVCLCIAFGILPGAPVPKWFEDLNK